MVWICFGDSAKGSLLCFQRIGIPDFGCEPVISLIDDLSIGDISDLQDQKKRAFGICPWKDDPEFAGEAEKCTEHYYNEAIPAFEAISEAVIWYGDSAFERCGMLRAAHDLYARGVPFSLVHVDCLEGEMPPPLPAAKASGLIAFFMDGSGEKSKLPGFMFRHTPQFFLRRIYGRFRQRQYRARQAQKIIFRGVGELEPETALYFYRRRRSVRACEAKLLYREWERLVQENAPLRAVENGRLISVPAEYYDETILENTPEKETCAAFVVGRTLGKHAINDCFIFARICALAACGKLEILQKGGNYRETTVRKPHKA